MEYFDIHAFTHCPLWPPQFCIMILMMFKFRLRQSAEPSGSQFILVSVLRPSHKASAKAYYSLSPPLDRIVFGMAPYSSLPPPNPDASAPVSTVPLCTFATVALSIVDCGDDGDGLTAAQTSTSKFPAAAPSSNLPTKQLNRTCSEHKGLN